MTRGAPLEADAIILSSQPHREHDLFLRAFVRGHGVLGFHVSGGRGSKRRDAGSLQPFVLGRLRADGRGILRRVEPTAAMHRSQLARDPLRYYAANLLAELYLPLPVEPSNDQTFDNLWEDMLHLHIHDEAPDTGFLVAAIGRLLRSAGVLPDPMHCSRCGCGLILARAGSQGFRCMDCVGSAAHEWSNPGWSTAALALLRAPAIPSPSEPIRSTFATPTVLIPATAGPATQIPTSNVSDLLRLAETLFGKEPRSWKGLASLLGRRQRLVLAAEGAA